MRRRGGEETKEVPPQNLRHLQGRWAPPSMVNSAPSSARLPGSDCEAQGDDAVATEARATYLRTSELAADSASLIKPRNMAGL